MHKWIYCHSPPQPLCLLSLEAFIKGVWDLVGSGKLPGVADDDHLVSQSLRFISTAICSGYYHPLFGSKETIAGLVKSVVVPNVGLRGNLILFSSLALD